MVEEEVEAVDIVVEEVEAMIMDMAAAGEEEEEEGIGGKFPFLFQRY